MQAIGALVSKSHPHSDVNFLATATLRTVDMLSLLDTHQITRGRKLAWVSHFSVVAGVAATFKTSASSHSFGQEQMISNLCVTADFLFVPLHT